MKCLTRRSLRQSLAALFWALFGLGCQVASATAWTICHTGGGKRHVGPPIDHGWVNMAMCLIAMFCAGLGFGRAAGCIWGDKLNWSILGIFAWPLLVISWMATRVFVSSG